MIGVLTIVTIIVYAQALPAEVDVPAGRVASLYIDTVRRIAKDGYYSESHVVTTSDGYILEMNRIPFGRNENRDTATNVAKPVIFLMHGLQGSALTYILLGSGEALAYILADEGYDVWMGNSRGALNSRQHVTLNPDDENDVHEFFDYTFEDIGSIDVPTMIDYVLDHTKQSKLHYVGHSQGGTSFLVMNSMLPEYNDKIISAHLLAGVGYQKHFPNKALSVVSRTTNLVYSYALSVGIIELLGPEWNNIFFGECSIETPEVCSLLIIKKIMSELLGPLEVFAGASIKQYAHYGQNIRDQSFRRWDYNPITNLIKYRSLTPPEYDISKITVETTMHYTLGDILLDERDVLAMAEVMPNTTTRKIARENYTHSEFVTASDSRELVYDYIVEALKKHK